MFLGRIWILILTFTQNILIYTIDHEMIMKYLSCWFLPSPPNPHPPWFPHSFGTKGYACWQEKSAKAISTLTVCPQLFPSASGKERPFSNWWIVWANSNMSVLVFSTDDSLGAFLSVLPSGGGCDNGGGGRLWHCLLPALCGGCCPIELCTTLLLKDYCIPGMMPSLNLCQKHKIFEGKWDPTLPPTSTFCASSQRCPPQFKHVPGYFLLLFYLFTSFVCIWDYVWRFEDSLQGWMGLGYLLLPPCGSHGLNSTSRLSDLAAGTFTGWGLLFCFHKTS